MAVNRQSNSLTQLRDATELDFLFITSHVGSSSVSPWKVSFNFVLVVISTTCNVVINSHLSYVNQWQHTGAPTRRTSSRCRCIIICETCDLHLVHLIATVTNRCSSYTIWPSPPRLCSYKHWSRRPIYFPVAQSECTNLWSSSIHARFQSTSSECWSPK